MNRKSIFIQIFSGFLITIAIFTILLVIFFNLGLRDASAKWSDASMIEMENIALRVVDNSINLRDISVDNPLFVYNSEKVLIYSNRGSGRKNIEDKEFIPLYSGSVLIGYYTSPRVHFSDNEANKQFTESITKAIYFAVFISTLLVLFIALMVSRNISLPTRKIVNFLQELTGKEYGKTIESRGALEIEKIITAVNRLSFELAKAEGLRAQWGRDIAHDLRTPVAALKAQFEGMISGALSLDRGRIDKNLQEILRMEYLVEDLSELMKLEDPKTELSIIDIDSSDFINQIKEISLDELIAKKIEVESTTSIDFFQGDEMYLYRAVSNIWTNAVRHTEVGGKITIDIFSSKDFNTLTISNRGDIIPPHEIDKIFDRLYRGEKARNTKGSGLGLTIAKEIVILHGGEIRVASDASGTSFNILLPVKAS